MSTQKKVCVFYSQGPHFARTLAQLRKAFPGSHLTILAPRKFMLTDELRAQANEVVETPLSHYTPRNPGACYQLVRRIRDARYDVFAVMFPSVQLQILAALSGTRHKVCCGPDGRMVRLRSGVLRTLCGAMLRAAWGRTVYAWVWLSVMLLPVRKRD